MVEEQMGEWGWLLPFGPRVVARFSPRVLVGGPQVLVEGPQVLVEGQVWVFRV